MGDMRVFHENPWYDYGGGPDHGIDEIDACHAEYDAGGYQRQNHVVIITADEYLALTAESRLGVTNLQVNLTGEARDAFIESIVIGALKSMRDVNEPLLRARWRAMAADTPVRSAVLNLIGNDGPEYEIVMRTLEEALGEA